MQKRIMIPVLAVIVGLVLTIGISAFTKAHSTKEASKFSNDYFQYSGADEMSGSLTNSANWTFLTAGLPSSNPCNQGIDLICVVNVADANLTGSGTKEQKFATYLSSVSGGAPNYVDTHVNYKKIQP